MYKNLPATSFLISPVVAAGQGFPSDSFRWMILWLCLDSGSESKHPDGLSLTEELALGPGDQMAAKGSGLFPDYCGAANMA